MSNTQRTPTPEAALIIPVWDAEPLVGPFRMKFDPSAAAGVPAHITLNYPFTPYFSRRSRAKAHLSSLLSAFTEFEFSLAEIRTFPDVIYLAPRPEGPFLALIQAIARAFPDSPPYEGAFAHPVPHLTVAQAEPDALPQILQDFSGEAKSRLPISSRATEVRLIENTEACWQTRAIFPLKPLMPHPPITQ